MAKDGSNESGDGIGSGVVDASHLFTARESAFTSANEDALPVRLALLIEEHSDLDAAIKALSGSAGRDGLSLARLKKKKLQLKDMIQRLKDQLTPDIIA
ncbi:MAG: YdcH family protein [Parvularculaceae bacterium]